MKILNEIFSFFEERINDSYEIIYNIKDINSSFEQIFVCKFILN